MTKLKFYYKNYKGVNSMRTVEAPTLWYGQTEYHKEMQWFIKAYDVEKEDFRDFAVIDINHFEGAI